MLNAKNVNVKSVVVVLVAVSISLLSGCAGSGGVGANEFSVFEKTSTGFKVLSLKAPRATIGIGESGVQATNNIIVNRGAGDHSTGNGAGTNPDNSITGFFNSLKSQPSLKSQERFLTADEHRAYLRGMKIREAMNR